MAEQKLAILGTDGQPLPPTRRKISALNGGNGRWGGPPYDAADLYSPKLADWQPYLWSPDGELNVYRDRIVSRARDLARNDGWASGAVTRILDNTIGANLRPIPKPDYRFLAESTGISAFDNAWAKEFARAVDGNWRSWALDLDRYCDATRNMNFTEIMRTAFRHKLIDGDALAIMMWIPQRVGFGRARYATAVQLIDPDRLSNPQLRFDQRWMRGGVEIDDYGAATGYYIRRARRGDWFTAQQSLVWDLVPRETPWGRPIVVHDFDGDRASQHRGGAGVFAPVVQRLKMLIKYDDTELDAAILNSIFAAYIESPFDQQLVTEALDNGERVSAYNMQRTEFHNESKLRLNNARIPILYPGEKIQSVMANRPGTNFDKFEGAVLRNVATGLGLSAQQVTNDWSNVNYSSARGALLEAWKTLDRRREDFAFHFCNPVRSAWLEKSFDVDDLPLPTGAPPYLAARSAYARCRWQSVGLGWLDPTQEAQAAIIRMDGALSTLEEECAQQGLDYEEVLEQRKYELGLFDEYNIPKPKWSGDVIVGGGSAQDAGTISKGPPKPQKPQKPTPE